MIIQCDHCSARFRMDDAKLANGPVKVRCAKCKEVFVVSPEEPTVESEPVRTEVSPPGDADFSFDATASDSKDFLAEQTANQTSQSSTSHQGVDDEFDWQSGFGSETQDAASQGDFSTAASPAGAVSAPGPDEFSMDSDFDFGDTVITSPTEPQQNIASQEAVQPSADDFSLDFGEVSFGDQQVTANQSGQVGAEDSSFSFDKEEAATSTDFSFSFDSGLSEKGDAASQSLTSDAASESTENVNFGEFSFGEIESRGEESLSNAMQAPASSVTAVVAGANGGAFDAENSFDGPENDEVPPSSITSRKKRGALFPLFIILGAVILLIALIGSGVYFFSGPKAFSKVGLGFLVEWYGDKAGEEGNISLKNVTATYVANSSAGELFVVKGEAVNNFKKPRASVQVKVSLLGQGGAALLSKSAYCGNSLSNEQLATLPAAKLDEIMNNQFGDSLANLSLKSGASIPFVIAVSQVPKDAIDYSVQVSGSTVAAPQ